MKIVQKQEDWNLFDFPKARKIHARISRSATIFSPMRWASWIIPARRRSSRIRPWRMRIDLSEQLAEFHADLCSTAAEHGKRSLSGTSSAAGVDPIGAERAIQGTGSRRISITRCCR